MRRSTKALRREERRRDNAGAALGLTAALAAYLLFFERRSAARRARILDRGRSLARDAVVQVKRGAQSAGWKVRGLARDLKSKRSDEHVPNEILVERVRAQIGRPVSHPRALQVRALYGTVILSGPILANEVDDLLRRVWKIRGVREVRTQFHVYPPTGDNPTLRGRGVQPAKSVESTLAMWPLVIPRA